MFLYFGLLIVLCRLLIAPVSGGLLSVHPTSSQTVYEFPFCMDQSKTPTKQADINVDQELSLENQDSKKDASKAKDIGYGTNIKRQACNPNGNSYTYQEYVSYEIVPGIMVDMGDYVCGPGSITTTMSKAITMGFTVSFQVTKEIQSLASKFLPSSTFTWNEANTRSTGYTTNCNGDAACFQYFQPVFANVSVAQYTVYTDGIGDACSTEKTGTGYISLPTTTFNCGGTNCEASGAFGSCYMPVDPNTGQPLCGKTSSPSDIVCPAWFAPMPST